MVTEAKRLMNDLPVLLASWMEEKSVTKKIDKMGTAKYMRTYEIPEEEAQQLGSLLADAAQEPRVQAFLSSLTFTDDQEITGQQSLSCQSPYTRMKSGRCLSSATLAGAVWMRTVSARLPLPGA